MGRRPRNHDANEYNEKRERSYEHMCREIAYNRFDLVREPDGIYRIEGDQRERIAATTHPWYQAWMFLTYGTRDPYLDL